MILTATRLSSPDTLTKKFSLDAEGQLVKTTGAQLARGTATRVELPDLGAFVELIGSLGPGECLTYGIAEHTAVPITSQRRLREAPGAITRTRENFHWPRGGAIWFLDYDPRGTETPLDAEQLRAQLIGVCPDLERAPMAITPSASSHIYRGSECLIGPRGLHVYIPVCSGSDIPRAGLALYERAWRAGLGFCVLDAAGRALPRSVVDAAVWQPERLDFANGAHCTPPLEQRRPAALTWNLEAEPFDTRAVASLDKSERAEFARILQQARAAVAEDADRVRKARLDAAPDESAREVLRAGLEDNRLGPAFVLYPDTGGTVTVRELLQDPQKWHGCEFADPLDPGYRNDPRIAVSKIVGVSRPYIYSHAHGGVRYALVREPTVVELVKGSESDAADRCLEALAAEGQTFCYAGSPAQIVDGRLVCIDPDYFAREISRNVAFFKRSADDRGATVLRRVSMPPVVSRYAFATARFSGVLPAVRGVITAPTLRKDGTVLDDPGFSKTDELYYHADDAAPRIPERPTREQVRMALEILRRPFRDYPFDSPSSAASCIAAVLAASIRRTLPVAPLILITAPTPGTGKTKLGQMLSIIAGDEGHAMPPPAGDEELHKTVIAAFRAGRNALLLDNYDCDITGRSLAVLASAANYSGRTLGRSEEASYPNGLLVLMTGNNVSPVGDLCRRTLSIGLDPQCENPYERVFDFDPVQLVADDRLRYVCAALVIIRGYLSHGEPDNRRALGGFEAWDRLVRQTVLWCGREFPGIWGAGDPLDSVRQSVEEDTQKSMLRRCATAMVAAFGDEPKSARDIWGHSQCIDDGATTQPLRAWLEELHTGGPRTDPIKSVGKFLAHAKNRIVDGRVLRGIKNRDVYFYRWQPVESTEALPTAIPATVDAKLETSIEELAQAAQTPADAPPADEWLEADDSAAPELPQFRVKVPEAKRGPLCAEIEKRGGVVANNGSGLIVSGDPVILQKLASKYRANLSPVSH